MSIIWHSHDIRYWLPIEIFLEQIIELLPVNQQESPTLKTVPLKTQIFIEFPNSAPALKIILPLLCQKVLLYFLSGIPNVSNPSFTRPVLIGQSKEIEPFSLCNFTFLETRIGSFIPSLNPKYLMFNRKVF